MRAIKSITSKMSRRKYSFEEVQQVKHTGGGLAVTWWVHHNISTIFTYFFANKNISPNTITFLSFIIWLIGCGLIVCFDSITWLETILVCLLFNFSYTLDCCDGQVARITGKSSTFGAWLDHVLDAICNFIILTAIYWYLIKSPLKIKFEYLFLSYSFSLFVALIYYFGIQYKARLYGKSFKLLDKEKKNNLPYSLINIGKNWVDTGVFLLVLLLLPFHKTLLYTLLIYYAIQLIQLIALFFLLYRRRNVKSS